MILVVKTNIIITHKSKVPYKNSYFYILAYVKLFLIQKVWAKINLNIDFKAFLDIYRDDITNIVDIVEKRTFFNFNFYTNCNKINLIFNYSTKLHVHLEIKLINFFLFVIIRFVLHCFRIIDLDKVIPHSIIFSS